MVDCCELLHALAQTEHRAECVTIVYIHMSDRRTESSMFLFCFFFLLVAFCQFTIANL